MTRIAQTFQSLRQKHHIALIPFIPAGYPDLATTQAILPALESAGANLIEIGFPFSDPIADGPIIQTAFTAALAKHIRVADIFEMIRQARQRVTIPLVAMISYSIVFRYGAAKFFLDAKSAGFDGLILPDLPPPDGQDICRQVQTAGLDTILLVAPTTSVDRRRQIAELSTGFIYYLSVAGTTGERDRLPADLPENLRQLRSLTDKPICVGFGVSQPQHVADLAAYASGAIVGSAFVRRIAQHETEGPNRIAETAAEYARELLAKSR